jgi:hypothetical protein
MPIRYTFMLTQDLEANPAQPDNLQARLKFALPQIVCVSTGNRILLPFWVYRSVDVVRLPIERRVKHPVAASKHQFQSYLTNARVAS